MKKAIKDTVSETRTKAQVVVQIQSEDLVVRQSIEKQIEEQHIGTIKSEDAGTGHVDFTVEVDSTNDSIPRIKDVLRAAGVRSTVRVSQ